MLPNFKLESYRERCWFSDTETDGTGSKKRTFNGRLLSVVIFTYPGGQLGKPFTLLTTYFAEQTYRVRFDRVYHSRWHSRLARQFEDLVFNDAVKRNALPNL